MRDFMMEKFIMLLYKRITVTRQDSTAAPKVFLVSCEPVFSPVAGNEALSKLRFAVINAYFK